MLKKRLIFTLLYDNGFFMLSRNFRLQRVGDFSWLVKNYDFARTATAIDELIILNVQRDRRSDPDFIRHLQQLCDLCFVPITAGGGIRDVDSGAELLSNGADKVLINTVASANPKVVFEIAERFGQQSIVLGIDLQRFEGTIRPLVDYGRETPTNSSISNYLEELTMLPVGEWYVNSVDRDGTGLGFDTDLLELLPPTRRQPLILAGGASKPEHFQQVFNDPRVSALATAHLFNFIGDGLQNVRHSILRSGHKLPRWDYEKIRRLDMRVMYD